MSGTFRPYPVARAAASPLSQWQGEIAFCLDDGQSVVLETGGGTVRAWDLTPGPLRVDLDQATLLSLVLGLRSFGECTTLQGADDSPMVRGVCEALFPRQPTASGPWG